METTAWAYNIQCRSYDFVRVFGIFFYTTFVTRNSRSQKYGFMVDVYKRQGEYYADMVINNSIILELKAADALRPEHEFQLINYLKATDIELSLIHI